MINIYRKNNYFSCPVASRSFELIETTVICYILKVDILYTYREVKCLAMK